MQDKHLVRTLEHIGFDDKEAAVYLALLALGRGTATEIAKESGLKRAIVYHVIDRLKLKGLAQELTHEAVKHFAVSDPANILHNIQMATDDLKFMLPLMRALQDKGRDKPRIEFFESKEAIISVYRSYERSATIRYVTSMKRLIEYMPEEVDGWMERHKKRTFKAQEKHLVTDTPVDRTWAKEMKAFGQMVKFLPKDAPMEMDFAITDSMLGITSFDPWYIVVIHSEKIARSAAMLFDLAWRQAD